jgi:glycosyltransferase involved in cell wall biosynthesis
MPEGTADFSTAHIQILVATMHRDSLSFLEPMFPYSHYSSYNIIVVNQSNEKAIKDDEHANVKVINTDTLGLSISRNIALENATGKFCVITDDDIVFQEGFEQHIITAFTMFPAAGAISFQYNRPAKENPVKSYSSRPFQHDNATIRGVSSIEMVVNRDRVSAEHLRFNVNFGLGAEFEVAEEFLFLRSLIEKDIPVYYYPAAIVEHNEWSSGHDHGSDRLVYARAALACKLYGNTAGLWLLKYLQFLVRKRLVQVTAVPGKFRVGMQGIKKYKSLLDEGKESRNA